MPHQLLPDSLLHVLKGDKNGDGAGGASVSGVRGDVVFVSIGVGRTRAQPSPASMGRLGQSQLQENASAPRLLSGDPRHRRVVSPVTYNPVGLLINK